MGRKNKPIQINSVGDKMKAESQCRLCSRLNRGNGARELTRHRLVPGRHGGEYIVANVIPLCRRCHDEVESQDAAARRMLRPKLWPLEVAHAIRKLSEEWFDLMYPKPAMMSLRLNQVEVLLAMERDANRNAPSGPRKRVDDLSVEMPISNARRSRKSALEGFGARGIVKKVKKRGAWEPDTAQIAFSEKSSARLRDMNIATISESA